MKNRTTWLLAATLVVALAACNPIVVTDSGVSSQATRVVRPTTTRVGGVSTPAVQIRMRDCQQVQLRTQGVEQDIALAPHAQVTDANGTVLFYSHDFLDQAEVRPAGSSDEPDVNGAHQIVVPVAGAPTPLTIRTWCDSYTPGSHGLYPVWSFPACTTSSRQCAASPKGAGTWSI